MSDQMTAEKAAPAAEAQPQAETSELAKIKADYDNQLRGLNRANSQLKKELEERSAGTKSVEERIAALEREKHAAERRAATMEAFGKHGLSEDFRSLFDIDDPIDRAKTLKSLLDDYTKDVQKKAASEFLREPEAARDPSIRQYSVDQLKGRTPQEINKLWSEGKIKGASRR